MLMRNLLLALTAILSSCARSPFPPPVPVEDDKSIVMPRFYDRPTITVGERGKYYYELDGELLRAMLIAANDLLPPLSKNVWCGNRLEAQRYIINRQGNLIFVYIYEDEEYCGGGYAALDSGARYAISRDGRILRRIFDGHPDDSHEWLSPDGGYRGGPAMPGVVPGFEPTEGLDSGSLPDRQEGGTAWPQPKPALVSVPDGGAPPDTGSPPDAGSPGLP